MKAHVRQDAALEMVCCTVVVGDRKVVGKLLEARVVGAGHVAIMRPSNEQTVAVIGTGAMGGRFAQRLLRAGFEVLVWNRSIEKSGRLTDLGAIVMPSPAVAAARADVSITMVSDPSALRAVTKGPYGVAAGIRPGSTVVEMSTVGPATISELRVLLPDQVHVVDAPVMGSVDAAEVGDLQIFVGGDTRVIEGCRSVLSTLGSVTHVGPLGSGSAAKLVANISLFAVLSALGEAIAIGRSLNLTDAAIFGALDATPLGTQARRKEQAIQSNDYPPRFALSLAHKDAELLAAAIADEHLLLRVTSAVRAWFKDSVDAGLGSLDYSAVLGHILDSNSRQS